MKTSRNQQSGIGIKFFTGFIRIRGVCTWFVISFIGFLLGITSLELTRYLPSLSFFIIATFFILSFTFSINNYYDIDTDKENPRRAALNALASGTISKHTGMLLILLFIIVPLVLSLCITWEVFLFCAFLLLFMWMYSAPPLRLKCRPGLDILWHFIALFALVLWGTFLAGFISHISILVAVSFGVYGCFAQLDNHIQDYPFDKASGSTTFAVRMGLRTTYKTLLATFILYIVTLLPLLILFSVHPLLTALIVSGGIIASIALIQIKKTKRAASLFHIVNIVGWSVYLNCLVYQFNILLY